MAYDVLASEERVDRTRAALVERGIQVELVTDGAAALKRIEEIIPIGASVSSGGSATLRQIGFEDKLKSGAHAWDNLKAKIVAAENPVEQTRLRREASLADYFLGSVHAIAETGELVFASGTGSQLPAYAFSSGHIIWVAGTQKIVPTLDEAIKRVREYCWAKEDAYWKSQGAPGSIIGKLLIFEREFAHLQREVRLILVNEVLGV